MTRSLSKISLIGLSLILTLLLIIPVSAATKPVNAKLKVYYAPLAFTFGEEQLAPPSDQQGFIYMDRTYLPLRFVAHSLGRSVEWDGENATVTISMPTEDELTEIETYNDANKLKGEAQVSEEPVTYTEVSAYTRQVTYIIDGEQVDLGSDLNGIFLNNRIFVPVRFVSEAIGHEIKWDQKTYSVSVQVEADAAEVQGESSTLNPPTITIGGGAGGGGVPVPSKPSYESLTADADSRLMALRNSCMSRLDSLLANTPVPIDYGALYSDVSRLQSSCDSQFNTIVSDVESKLTVNGYATDIIATYRATYADQKEEEEARVLIQLGL